MNVSAFNQARIAREKNLRQAMMPFVAPSMARAVVLLAATLGVYAAGTWLAGFADVPLWLRIAGALVAGFTLPSLFVIGHDAAHGAYTASKTANAIMARIALIPELHNYSLWVAVHNRQHHRAPNLKGHNSWSPLDVAEYRALPMWRRAVERLYRSPAGFAPYYLVERWWRDKFMPRHILPGVKRADAWRDFALLAAYLVLLVGALAWSGGVVSVVLGFVVPYLIWNHMMGTAIYLQHTNARAPWFASIEAWRRLGGEEEVTVHVRMPRWYGALTHHIMDHPAHHIQPLIPLYRLPAAQARLNELLGPRAVVEDFSLRYLFGTMRACKLYDYGAGHWCDFAGRPTGPAYAAEMPAQAA
jgi:acyl-lipid omega-6 desaturase (Delta-12 desaturase)